MSEYVHNKSEIKICPVARAEEQKGFMSTHSICVSSALEAMLKKDTNMFDCARIIRDMMSIEGLDEKVAADALGVNESYINKKMSLKVFTKVQEKQILRLEIPERAVVALAAKDKQERSEILCDLRAKKLFGTSAYKYIMTYKSSLRRDDVKENIPLKKRILKGKLSELGLVFNSIDRVVELAKRYGLSVDYKNMAIPDGAEISIKLKKPD